MSLINIIRPVVVAGPSGVGKSTLIRMLTKEFPDKFGFSVSHTTRDMRPSENDGVDYHFITVEEFHEKLENGDFLENAEYSDNLYGTSKEAVVKVANENKCCILDIEMNGVQQLYNNVDIDPKFIFIRPPSVEELEKRLRGRQDTSEEAIQKRLKRAVKEISIADTEGYFDAHIINGNKDEAYLELKEVIISANPQLFE
eukprot:TRINITY_DN1646_c4_g1_i1.p1 TRINITY_DN1646_c4_g1~~TRINITY_DN1646_c4_g1_i1.p1  ORF type:complete len:199 (-),score=72.21 TRINITY_DN1646_c4_g1_i1:263-859(-)